MDISSLWETLEQAAGQPDDGRLGLRAWLTEKADPALYRPRSAPGAVVSALGGRDGAYYVLKNPVAKTYYRLGDRDYALWQKMDGTQTVKDLVVAYFLEYGSFAFARVAALVEGLKASLLLSEPPTRLYRHVQERLRERSPTYRLNRLGQAFLQRPFPIGGLDRMLAGAYRWGGWLLFTWPLQVLFLIASLAGLYFFVQALRAGQYGVATIAGSYRLGVIGLIIGNLVAIFLHEMAHALTVKRYGREVRRGGFMIYFGLPAFFVDTTDIWLEGKKARLSVTWAGPYSGLILGGLASMALAFLPEIGLNALLFQFAFLCYLLAFLNLNPLLELDGYYLLMDWLEIPMLRRKSFAFWRTGLWAKIEKVSGSEGRGMWPTARSTLASFSREERIFAVFGLLSAAWTAYAIYLGAYFWQQRLAGALQDLWAREGGLGKFLLALATLALGLVFVLSISLLLLRLIRTTWGWLARRGLFASTRNVAVLLGALVLAGAVAPRALGLPILTRLLSLASLAGAVLLAWRNANDYRGARLSRVFTWLGAASLLFLASEAVALLLQTVPLGPMAGDAAIFGFAALGYGSLVVAGLILFSDTDLARLGSWEKALLIVGLVASYGLVLGLARSQHPSGNSAAASLLVVAASLAPLLALTLHVPTLFSYWRTALGPAWGMLALALAALTLSGVALSATTGLPAGPGTMLLASALALHQLAFRRVPEFLEAPSGDPDLSDERRLWRAFEWTANAVVAQFRPIAGERPARILVQLFNNYTQAAGWGIRIVRFQVQETCAAGPSLPERGQGYARALDLLLDLVARESGEKLTRRFLQRAYDRLPWEAREIGAEYLFGDVKRDGSLSQAFQATRREFWTLLRRMPLFATMDDGEIDLLCSRLKSEQSAPGQTIIRQGESGDRFYIVRRGHVEVSQRDEQGVETVVNQLDRGDVFGEVALLRDAPRNATCRATMPTELLSLSRDDFCRLVEHRFALGEKVDRAVRKVELLRAIPLFTEMDGRQIRRLAAQLQEETFQEGETIIRQGEVGATFYLVETGRIQVCVASDAGERIVTERGPGEYVGEIALLLDLPRTATIRALTPVSAWVLHKTDFDRLVSDSLYVGRGLERDASRRLIDLRKLAPEASSPVSLSVREEVS